MMNSLSKKKSFFVLCGALLCCGLLLFFFADTVLATAGAKVATYIDKTYDYEKGSGSKVLTEEEAKKALTSDIDLLMLASGRDTGRTAVTDDEFSTYLGYVNVHLRNGNGSYSAADFLRAALAVGASGGDPSSVGTDAAGNRVDLLYKGLYSRSLSSLEKEGTKTVAYGLLAVDANRVSDEEMRASGSKVSRAQLKSSLIASVNSLSLQGVPDVGTSALAITALSADYVNGDSAVVAAVDKLLVKLSGLQAADGILKDSPAATAETLTALCALGVDPTDNRYFDYDLYQGLLRFYCSDGGFASVYNGSSSSSATAAARCGLVAYLCYQEDGLFYDFSGVKGHSVKSIASPSSSTSSNSSPASSNKSTASSSSSSSNGKSSSKSSGKSSNTSSAPDSSSSNSSSKSTAANAAQGSTVAKSVFEGIKGKDESYVYEGTWGEEEPYTLSFKGTDITTPMDFNAGLSSVASHQMEIDAAAEDVEYIVFLHAGDFPGKATATITVSLPDGSYQCYHYNETAGKFTEVSVVTVANGMVSFSLDVGGEYFLTSDKVNTEGHNFDTSDTIDGVVPASVFEDLAGKDVDLTLEGSLESGIAYEIIFNGTDITDPMDFDTRISEQSIHAGAIADLAKDPLILSFYHQGDLPGKATVKLYTNLDKNQTYGLYYFNSEEQQGEYCDEVVCEDDVASFVMDHCSDYFIAPYHGQAVLTSATGSRNFTIAALLFELLLVLAAVGAVLYRRRGKGGLQLKRRKLPASLSLKKKKKDEIPAEELTLGTEADVLESDGMDCLEDMENGEDPIISDAENLIGTEELPYAEEILSDTAEPMPPAMDYASFARPVKENDKEN